MAKNFTNISNNTRSLDNLVPQVTPPAKRTMSQAEISQAEISPHAEIINSSCFPIPAPRRPRIQRAKTPSLSREGWSPIPAPRNQISRKLRQNLQIQGSRLSANVEYDTLVVRPIPKPRKLKNSQSESSADIRPSSVPGIDGIRTRNVGSDGRTRAQSVVESSDVYCTIPVYILDAGSFDHLHEDTISGHDQHIEPHANHIYFQDNLISSETNHEKSSQPNRKDKPQDTLSPRHRSRSRNIIRRGCSVEHQPSMGRNLATFRFRANYEEGTASQAVTSTAVLIEEKTKRSPPPSQNPPMVCYTHS